jgi:hypothetical protein
LYISQEIAEVAWPFTGDIRNEKENLEFIALSQQ